MKKKFVLVFACVMFAALTPAFAIEEDSVHFGFNYSPTFSSGGG